jgi:hypothetical protein
VRWSDGLSYCTPDSTDTIFASSECTRALGRVPSGGGVPPYFARHGCLDGSCSPSRLHLAGEQVEAPVYGWELRDGACLGPYEVAGFGSAGVVLREVGPVLPPGTFAAATIAVDHSK